MIASFFKRFSSFAYLNATQFLGSLNDNIYKLLIVYFFIQLEGFEYSHEILATTGATFVIPFILFSAMSGTLADRLSKRDIIVTTKILELLIIGLGVLALAFQSKWGSYCILFLLAAQSALFGPSKYGIVPELVPKDQISKANGMMTSMTFFAIILGTFLASFLLQITNRNFIVSSIFCTFIALVGLLTSFCIEHTPPAGSSKKIKLFFLEDIYNSLKFAMGEVSLLPAILGSAFFLFIGAFTQLNIIPFAVESLGLSDVEGGYLFFLTAMGIGIGALIAGKVSGKTVELGLVPFGALGITICSFMLDIFSNSLLAVIPLVFLLGMFGGIFEIPLDAYVQVSSPKKMRGQMVAASNFLSFMGVLLASGLIYINSALFHLKADKGFVIIGTLCFFVFIIYTVKFFDYLTRYIGSLLARFHFKTVVHGAENIPDCPAIYVCCHKDWNDTLLILGSQRRRMRFFIEHEQSHRPFMRRLYHLFRVIFIPPLEPLERNAICLSAIEKALKKGFSVCIFIESWDIYSEADRLQHSPPLSDIISVANYPIIPVQIIKGPIKPTQSFLNPLLKKFRNPASLSFGSMIYQGHSSLLETPYELCIEE